MLQLSTTVMFASAELELQPSTEWQAKTSMYRKDEVLMPMGEPFLELDILYLTHKTSSFRK